MGLKGPRNGIWSAYRSSVFLAISHDCPCGGPLMSKTPKCEEEEEHLLVHTRLPPCGIWWVLWRHRGGGEERPNPGAFLFPFRSPLKATLTPPTPQSLYCDWCPISQHRLLGVVILINFELLGHRNCCLNW